ncbi:HEPN domain-containing protein, partial [Sphingobium sp. AN641]|uniref:ApeA N-terminal domain 1-containing protein n=1 Tax=Sphingobium sp. AN641 TaxID=3133443 RepID=UPI0030C0BC6D
FVRSSMGSATRNGESYTFAEVYPAYVLSGNRHIDVGKPSIKKLTFHVDDADQIFYDFDVLGHVIEPEPLIESVVKANKRWVDRDVPTGPTPQIIYFTGRCDLAQVETVIGTVRVFHCPSFPNPLSSPRFAAIQNWTLVEVAFPEPQEFFEALNRVLTLRRFLSLIAGRPQNIDNLQLHVGDSERDQPLDVYWTRSPSRSKDWEQQRPHPSEILSSVVQDPEGFNSLLARWLTVDADRLDARARFANGFDQQRSFPIDRLVGAANMFDILPANALPEVTALTEELASAKQEARKIFNRLPQSPERDSVLGALGRIGRPTLRDKIRYRADIVSRALKKPLPDLDIVTDEAVKCRNHYVHGSPASISYAEHPDIRVFLTRVLEFIFAASDLLDAGWDIQQWRSQGSVGAHPFNDVLLEWSQQTEKLRLLREGARKA